MHVRDQIVVPDGGIFDHISDQTFRTAVMYVVGDTSLLGGVVNEIFSRLSISTILAVDIDVPISEVRERIKENDSYIDALDEIIIDEVKEQIADGVKSEADRVRRLAYGHQVIIVNERGNVTKVTTSDGELLTEVSAESLVVNINSGYQPVIDGYLHTEITFAFVMEGTTDTNVFDLPESNWELD